MYRDYGSWTGYHSTFKSQGDSASPFCIPLLLQTTEMLLRQKSTKPTWNVEIEGQKDVDKQVRQLVSGV